MPYFTTYCMLIVLAAASALAQPFPDAPLGEVVAQTSRQVCQGLTYIHRRTADPLDIHVLAADLSEPGISVRAALSNGAVWGNETVLSMVQRRGAVAGINGDYWTVGGVPLNLTAMEGEIVVAPKHRTAFVLHKDGTPEIGIWTGGWGWASEAVAPNGERRPIMLLNSDCNPGWLCLYTDTWGRASRGDEVAPVVEVLCGPSGEVIEIRRDRPGISIPADHFVLTGRDDAGEWLAANFAAGDRAALELKADKPLDTIEEAVGAGPRILKDGEYFQDPMAAFPEGEEFTVGWKRSHYLERHPRSALGLSKDKKTIVLLTVDGRQPQHSIGVYQRQAARLLKEFGAWDGMDLDSGGSATMVVEDQVVNHPSDEANPDGTDGVPRPVANGLLIFCE